MTGRALVACALVLVLVGIGIFAITRSGDGTAPAALLAVCDVAALAGAGDQEAAQAAFRDRAHEPLHELATAAADSGDRSAAGRLLEAKNVVESAEPGPTPAAAEYLVNATRVALAAVDRPSPPPCP